MTCQPVHERFGDRRIVLDDQDPHGASVAQPTLRSADFTEPLPFAVIGAAGRVRTVDDMTESQRSARRRQLIAGAVALTLTALTAVVAVGVSFGAANAQVSSQAGRFNETSLVSGVRPAPETPSASSSTPSSSTESSSTELSTTPATSSAGRGTDDDHAETEHAEEEHADDDHADFWERREHETDDRAGHEEGRDDDD
jgi:hypothetical protein